jgi:prolyl oligopeptidase PreP (S9A serine peptidase family)
MLRRKQNVFDDFIACAEYLCATGVSEPRRIGIHGGSNGGLLVLACALQVMSSTLGAGTAEYRVDAEAFIIWSRGGGGAGD